MMMHKHHIIPKHMGGGDEPSNLFECTVEQHAELHLALYLEHGHWEDWYAAMGLSGQIGKEDLIAEVCRKAAQQPRSEEFKKKISAANRRRGPMSEETKRRISEARKGKPAHNKGKKMSEEQRKKMREARLNDPDLHAKMKEMRSRRGEQQRGADGRYK